MHLRLFVILFLISNAKMMSPTGRKQSVNRDVSEDCRSCLDCSKENGCLRCPEKLFLFLQREGMSHHGLCLPSCPAGHYGLRGQDMNRCLKCKAGDCERCFSRDFCTKCRGGFQLFKGRCLHNCPPDTVPHLSDCIEGCHFSPWSDWTTCVHGSLSCGFRWGRQTRSRGPTEASQLCPTQSESKKCRLQKRCPGEKRRKERRGERKRERALKKLQNNATVTKPPGGT